jgi:hypothetical protein
MCHCSSSRLRSKKRVAYYECSSSADEDSDSDLDSPPSLIRMADNTIEVRKKAVSISLLQMQVHHLTDKLAATLQMQVRHLTDKLAATKRDLDQENEQHDSATNKIICLKQDVANLKAYEGVANELEIIDGALVDTQDELVYARKEKEKGMRR